MTPRSRAAIVALALASGALLGCTTSERAGGYPDATLDFGSRRDGGTDVPPYVHPSDALPTLRPRASGLPLPIGVEPARLILPEKVELTAAYNETCTHQEPPSGDGDRWCVFDTPGSMTKPGSTKKNVELWVINVSQAARGPVPKCDGTDPNCLRLTLNLWTEFPLGGPGHPFAQAFAGDTLIFYADATSVGDEIHQGPVFAWRPGWPRARQLSSERGVACYGHPRAPVAFCMDDMKGDPKRPDSFELRAGVIADPGGGVLTSLGRITPFNTTGDVAWQASFSRAGDFLAISSPDPDPAVEVLRVVPTNAIGAAPPPVALTDLTSWTISNDDRRIYFYRKHQPDNMEDKSLFAADFPSGAGVTHLASPVKDYFVVGDRETDDGVAFLTKGNNANEAAFGFLRDSANPASAITVFTYRGLLEGVRISSDLRFTAWLDASLRGRVVRTDNLAVCTFNREDSGAYNPQFSGSAGLLFWTEDAVDDPFRRDAYYMNPDGCKGRQRLSQGSEFYYPIGDRGLIFGDEFAANERTVTLKYAHVSRVGEEWRVEEAIRIQDHVDGYLTLVGINPMMIVFRTKAGGARPPGVYVFGPVPF